MTSPRDDIPGTCRPEGAHSSCLSAGAAKSKMTQSHAHASSRMIKLDSIQSCKLCLFHQVSRNASRRYTLLKEPHQRSQCIVIIACGACFRLDVLKEAAHFRHIEPAFWTVVWVLSTRAVRVVTVLVTFQRPGIDVSPCHVRTAGTTFQVNQYPRITLESPMTSETCFNPGQMDLLMLRTSQCISVCLSATYHLKLVLITEFLTTFIAAVVVIDPVSVKVAHVHGTVIAMTMVQTHMIDQVLLGVFIGVTDRTHPVVACIA